MNDATRELQHEARETMHALAMIGAMVGLATLIAIALVGTVIVWAATTGAAAAVRP